ncbi:co-chaperone YbbN [Pseudoruegeria sp. SK021]|uniref:thioredoxin family protein n=1 Tax=Pseudoruegeria sp. SK021 TaxID=1933035 RepID=UPI000A2499CB|nr:thioredoxin domain-containing protein [Pseudoruegeria sp. SK021]OSP54467.1 thiol reductase thioredoxin [Pseudoruegeria sp. SK021]
MTEPAKLICATCGQANRVPAAKLSAGPICGTCGAKLVDAKVAALDPTTHAKLVKGHGLPVIVDYWAPWCGPCRQMAPEFAKAAQGFGGKVRFAKIDTQDHPGVSQKLNIRGIPLLILYQNGREVARLTGSRPAAEITGFIRSNARVPA